MNDLSLSYVMIKEVTKNGRVGFMADFSFFFTNFPDHFFEKDLWKVV